MQLTQKHFQFIAQILAQLEPIDLSKAVSRDTPKHEQWATTVETFANALEQTNPKFKRDLFLKEAGLEFPTFDFVMQHEGSLCLFRPQNADAKEWLLETAPEDAQFFGDAIACEHRYVSDMISVIEQEGMSVQ